MEENLDTRRRWYSITKMFDNNIEDDTDNDTWERDTDVFLYLVSKSYGNQIFIFILKTNSYWLFKLSDFSFKYIHIF